MEQRHCLTEGLQGLRLQDPQVGVAAECGRDPPAFPNHSVSALVQQLPGPVETNQNLPSGKQEEIPRN